MDTIQKFEDIEIATVRVVWGVLQPHCNFHQPTLFSDPQMNTQLIYKPKFAMQTHFKTNFQAPFPCLKISVLHPTCGEILESPLNLTDNEVLSRSWLFFLKS